MRSHHALTLVALGCLFTAPVLAQEHHAAGPLSDEELIKSAESAAPMAIAKEATIIAVTADGKIRTIRKGTNNFTCMPDNPTTPGPHVHGSECVGVGDRLDGTQGAAER